MKNVSQREIASVSGVSQSAVSAALSDSSTVMVSEETRRRVLETAARLGYRKRFLVTNGWGHVQTKTIAWVSQMKNTTGGAMPAVQRAAAAREQDLMTHVVNHLAQFDYSLTIKPYTDGDQLREWVAKRPVEGIIWRAGYHELPLFSEIATQIPVVVVNRSLAPGVDRVLVNQEENVALPIEHLLKAGHRRIAYFGHVPGMELFATRRQTYDLLMSRHGLHNYPEFLAISDDRDLPSPEKAVKIFDCWEALGPDRPTALILIDIHALHLLPEAQRRGISIPGDLSLVGIDNLAASEISHPHLTSMDQSYDEIGRELVDFLVSRIEQPARPARAILVSPRLIQRQSVRTLPH